MFGYNYPDQAGDTNQNWNTNEPVNPLRESDGFSVDQWFGHGYKAFPPVAGDFMDLPSGGTYMGELACNRADSKMRDPARTDAQPMYACSVSLVSAVHRLQFWKSGGEADDSG